MNNAEYEEWAYGQTFLEKARDVLAGPAWLQTVAVAALFLLALGVRRAVKSDGSRLQLLVLSVAASFFVWPYLFLVVDHLRDPTNFPAWFEPPSLLVFFDLVILLNQAACMVLLLCIPAWFLSERLTAWTPLPVI